MALVFEGVKHLVGDKKIIRDKLIRNEGALCFVNTERLDPLKLVHQNRKNNLGENRTQINWIELGYMSGMVHIQEKNDIGGIKSELGISR